MLICNHGKNASKMDQTSHDNSTHLRVHFISLTIPDKLFTIETSVESGRLLSCQSLRISIARADPTYFVSTALCLAGVGSVLQRLTSALQCPRTFGALCKLRDDLV